MLIILIKMKKMSTIKIRTIYMYNTRQLNKNLVMSSESPKDSASIEKSPWKGPSLAIQRSEFFENIKFYKRSIKFSIYFELKESILLYKVKMRRIESILDVNCKIYRKENNGKYKDICISFSISYFNSNATWNALQV